MAGVLKLWVEVLLLTLSFGRMEIVSLPIVTVWVVVGLLVVDGAELMRDVRLVTGIGLTGEDLEDGLSTLIFDLTLVVFVVWELDG